MILFSIFFFAVTKSTRANLQFPVGRITRHLREGNYAKRISASAGVYMASVLEYLSSEILDLSGQAAMANKRVRINPRHVMLSVSQDAELSELLRDVTFPAAGVTPFIHSVLLPNHSKKKYQEEETYQADDLVNENLEQSEENVELENNEYEDEHEEEVEDEEDDEIISETSVEQ